MNTNHDPTMKLNLQDALAGKIDEQLNLALCEWRGLCTAQKEDWEHTQFYVEYNQDDEFTCKRCGSIHFRPGHSLPNHITAPESLGLVHEVEGSLPEHHGYIGNLKRVCSGGVARCISATARQRVIAILQTVKPKIFEP